ncbi:MAG: DsbA family protein [Anaerolineae bacterium]|nr:DsbA family protein [Gemmatimonadaceae bacterium]
MSNDAKFRAALLAFAIAAISLSCGATEAERKNGATSERASSPGGAASAAPDTLLQLADSARIQGQSGAPLWIVEVSDFQCPYCAEWHAKTYHELKREFIDNGKARFAYINLPLPSHTNAWPAASAAMCAGLQGKFWEMHDALFSAQSLWATEPIPGPVFQTLASKAGIDGSAMSSCMSSKRLQPLIQADYDRAVQSGINSTPSFIVGGVMLTGAHPIENFRRIIDSLAASAASRSP